MEKKISKRAKELGAKKHLNVNVELPLWKQIIKPLIWSGSMYQDKYPASDFFQTGSRYIFVRFNSGNNSFSTLGKL